MERTVVHLDRRCYFQGLPPATARGVPDSHLRTRRFNHRISCWNSIRQLWFLNQLPDCPKIRLKKHFFWDGSNLDSRGFEQSLISFDSVWPETCRENTLPTLADHHLLDARRVQMNRVGILAPLPLQS